MRLPEKQQTELYDSYWSKLESLFRGSEKTFDAFLRDYLAFKTKARKQEKADEIYQAFRRSFAGLQESCCGLETQRLRGACISERRGVIDRRR